VSLERLQEMWNRARRSAVGYGALATSVRVGANILLLPVVLTRLSAADMAMWWVFVALGGFANLADFGFGAAISRVFSLLWAGAKDFEAEGIQPAAPGGAPNFERIRALAATVRSFYWRLAVGATLLLAFVGSFVIRRPATNAAEPGMIWLSWALFVVVIGWSLGTSYWMIACQGVNRMRELQAANLYSGLSYVVSASALLLAGGGLWAMVAATALLVDVMRWACRRAYLAAVPDEPGPQPRPEPRMLSRLWPNASKFATLSIGAYCITSGSVLIASHYLGAELTASFGLTAQLGTFMMSFASLWLQVKWPQLTILRTQGRLEEMSIIFARRLALTMVTFGLLALAVWLFGNMLLEWKGTRTRLLSGGALCFYLFYLAQQVLYVQFGSLIYTENVVPLFKVALYTGVGMMGLSLMLTPLWGLWGLLLAPLIAEWVCSAWITVWRGFRGQALTPGRFVRVALGGQA
jgi:O-antigen/teichoic acid export membrane protein